MARSDSEVLTHYLEGRVRGDGEDRLQIRKLKEVGIWPAPSTSGPGGSI